MAAPVALDTGPCVALFDRHDAHHQRAVRFVQSAPCRFYSNVAIVTEAMWLLGFEIHAQMDFLAWIRSGAVTLIEPEAADYVRVSRLMPKYADLPMDFADGLLVALCERLGINQIATVDDDFRIYRLHGRLSFDNVFLNGRP